MLVDMAHSVVVLGRLDLCPTWLRKRFAVLLMNKGMLSNLLALTQCHRCKSHSVYISPTPFDILFSCSLSFALFSNFEIVSMLKGPANGYISKYGGYTSG